MNTSTDDFYVQAYQFDDEITVVADLPGVSIDDLKVERIYGTRVPLPGKSIDYSQARLEVPIIGEYATLGHTHLPSLNWTNLVEGT